MKPSKQQRIGCLFMITYIFIFIFGLLVGGIAYLYNNDQVANISTAIGLFGGLLLFTDIITFNIFLKWNRK